MIIGVPREIKEQEDRVGLLPSGVYQLAKRGHQVLIEAGAGVGSGYRDEDYRNAGAELTDDHAGVFRRAELIDHFAMRGILAGFGHQAVFQ